MDSDVVGRVVDQNLASQVLKSIGCQAPTFHIAISRAYLDGDSLWFRPDFEIVILGVLKWSKLWDVAI